MTFSFLHELFRSSRDRRRAAPRPASAGRGARAEGGSHLGGLARAVGLAAACVTACGPDDPPVLWEGEHLRYASSVDVEICEGTFEVSDAFVAALAREFGVSLARPAYFAFVERDQLGDYCGVERPITGCATEGKAYSGERMHFHEIVHLVAGLAGVQGPLAFQEGLAEVYDDDGNEGERQPIDDVLARFEERDDHYYTAALFVRFLFERHGREAVLEFMRRTEEDDPRERWAPIFASVTGETIESATAAFSEYPSCTAVANRVSLYQCGLPAEPWDADALDITAELECSLPDVMGPAYDPESMVTARGFEIPATGLYWLSLGSDDDAGAVRITRCGSCWDSYELVLKPGDTTLEALEAGRYFATFGRPPDEPGALTLDVSPP